MRSCEMSYGEDNVIELNIVKEGTFLHMAVTGYGSERDNLDEPDELDIRRNEADEEIARRLKEGQTYMSIQRDLGVSPRDISKVSRNIKRSCE